MPRQIERRDPYCLLDPICVSPFYRWSEANYDPTWEGSATSLNDPLVGGHDGYRAIALVNFAFYSAIALLLLTSSRLLRPKLARSVALIVLTWCALEWLRWNEAAWAMSIALPTTTLLQDWTTYALPVLLGVPVLAAWFAIEKLRNPREAGSR